jgi:hypothetical protein
MHVWLPISRSLVLEFAQRLFPPTDPQGPATSISVPPFQSVRSRDAAPAVTRAPQACRCPVESSPNSDHGEGFAHPRADELFGVRVQDDVEERLRVAIEYRRHDAMAGCRHAVAEDRIDFRAREQSRCFAT